MYMCVCIYIYVYNQYITQLLTFQQTSPTKTQALELLDREQQRLYSLDADPSFRVQTSTATA